MKIILLALLFLGIVIPANAQFKTFKKKDKIGIMFNDIVIQKAKFDSVIIGDTTIATAYKKNKIYYYNQLGKKVYKGLHQNAAVFEGGLGIVSNKKGKYGIISYSGSFIMKYKECAKPIRYNNLIYIPENINFKNELYNNYGSLENDFDSLEIYQNLLATTNSVKEEYTYMRKRLLRKPVRETAYRTVTTKKLYNTLTGKKITSKIKTIEDYGTNIITHIPGYFPSIYSKNGDYKLTSILDLKIINETLFTGKIKGYNSVFTAKDLKLLIASGRNTKFAFNEATIYAFEDTTDLVIPLSIYNYEGDILVNYIGYVYVLDSNRVVFSKDSLQYIGNEFGEKLSDYYHGFGKMENGYRLVYDKFSYSYINDETYAKVPADFPIIGRRKSTMRSSGGGRFAHGLMNGIINVFRVITLRRPISMPYSPAIIDPDKIVIIEDGEGFSNGYAIVCLYGVENDNQYDSLTLINGSENLYYNYIDTLGNYFSSKKYKTCYPFNSGVAMVKTDKGFSLINTQGKTVKKFTFHNVTRDENGYFIVTYYGKYGLISPNYEVLLACEHGYLKFEKGKCISREYDKEKGEYEDSILYEIPKEK